MKAQLALAAILGMATLTVVPSSAASVATEAYAANIRLDTVFLAETNKLADSNSQNEKIKQFAATEGRQQAGVLDELDTWQALEQRSGVPPIVTASNAMQTGRSIGEETTVDVTKFVPPPGVGVLMPPAGISVGRLSEAKGGLFDSLYKPAQVSALQQLAGLYNAYAQTGDDPMLRSLALRELPRIKASIETIGRI